MVRQAPFPHPLVPLGISASIPLNCLCFLVPKGIAGQPSRALLKVAGVSRGRFALSHSRNHGEISLRFLAALHIYVPGVCC